jgi:hypothetical protein
LQQIVLKGIVVYYFASNKTMTNAQPFSEILRKQSLRVLAVTQREHETNSSPPKAQKQPFRLISQQKSARAKFAAVQSS